MPARRAESCRAARSVHVSDDELASILRAVETAYEAACHLSDVGRIHFGPFED